MIHQKDMGVSKNRGGPPKSSILIGFSIVNHPFWCIPIFGNAHILLYFVVWTSYPTATHLHGVG